MVSNVLHLPTARGLPFGTLIAILLEFPMTVSQQPLILIHCLCHLMHTPYLDSPTIPLSPSPKNQGTRDMYSQVSGVSLMFISSLFWLRLCIKMTKLYQQVSTPTLPPPASDHRCNGCARLHFLSSDIYQAHVLDSILRFSMLFPVSFSLSRLPCTLSIRS